MNRPKDIRVATPDRLATFNKAVGEWLKDARIRSGKSLDDGASAIAGSTEQIEAIENGIRSIAGSEFHALIAAYQLELDDVNEFLQEYGLQI